MPTIAEAGVPGYEMDSWLGIVAPAGTPSPVLDRLNAEFNRALVVPQVREKLAAQGLDVVGGSVADFSRTIRADYDRFTRVIKSAGIKAD